MRMVGGYNQGPLQINPTPITGSPYIPDPLLGLPSIPTTLTVRSSNRLTIGNGQNAACSILEPGVYVGGIDVKSQGSIWLRPGIFVIQGGGLSLGAQSNIYTLSGDASITNCTALDSATWETALCPQGSCGVLIYNTIGTGNGANSALGALDLGGGSGIKMRAYQPTVDRTNTNQPAYKNVIFWQWVGDAATGTLPSSTYHQPILSLRGGGTAFMQGTVYAPSASVSLGGNCGGSGGTPLDLTLQFISWDLEISGSCTFHFIYNVNDLAFAPVYGLVQ